MDAICYMEVVLKCADISDAIKPFPVTKKWTLRITDELFLQVLSVLALLVQRVLSLLLY